MLRAPERAACTVMPESCWKSHLPTATIHGDERNRMLLLQAHLGRRQTGLGLWVSCSNLMFTPQLKCTKEEVRASGHGLASGPHARMPFPALGWDHLLGVSGSPSVNQRCP